MAAADQHIRDEALDPIKSFIVTAPAGSGKTELLTQRLLSLLSTVSVPEEILAITFTKKAASEMRQRVLTGIRKGLSPEPELVHEKATWALARTVLERDSKLGWHLLENPNRLRVQTIDSFCASLSRQMPLLSSMGGAPEVTEDSSQLYLEATRNLLSRLEQEGELPEILGRLLLYFDNNLQRLQNILISMLSQRDQWLPHVISGAISIRENQELLKSRLEDGLRHLVVDGIQRASDLIPEHWWSELYPLGEYLAENLRETDSDNELVNIVAFLESRDIHEDALPGWRSFAELILTKQGGVRKSLSKAQGFLAQTAFKTVDEKQLAKANKDVAKGLLEAFAIDPRRVQRLALLKLLPSPNFSDMQWKTIGDLCQLLPQLVSELFLVFQQKGQVDFIQIAASADEALGDDLEPTELSLKLDYGMQHILVDEFQDTSLSQIRLLDKLTATWQPDDNRTVFLVGDAMQSIYRFRASDVSLFLKVKAQGLSNVELKPLNLTVNFRSQAKLVEWVNLTFEQGFPPQDDISLGAIQYSPSIPFKSSLEQDAVLIHLFEKNETQDHQRAEANKIAEQITQIRNTDPTASIAILIRSRAQVLPVGHALRCANVPIQAVDIDPLATNEAVVDLCSLTRAILHPGDKIAWFALLRAPWCGLTLKALQLLDDYGNNENAIYFKLLSYIDSDEIPADDKLRLTKIISVLRPIIERRWRKPLRQVLTGAWQALGGLQIYPETELTNIESYLDLVEGAVEDGSLADFSSIEAKLQALYVKADVQSINPVQITTLHKSKGLQYDYVFIPGLDRRTRGDDKKLLLWKERVDHSGDIALVMAPVESTGSESDPIYRCLAAEEKERAALESTRLLYVGCTRAIKQLHLLGAVKKDGEKISEPKNSLLASIWPQVDDNHPIEATSVISTETLEGASTDLKRVSSNFEAQEFQLDDSLAHYRIPESTNEGSNIPDLSWELKTEAKVGTLAHRVFRQFVLSGLDSYRQRDSVELRAAWQAQLTTLGMTPDFMEDSLDYLQLAVTNALYDTEAEWLFKDEYKNSATEMELGFKSKKGIRKLIIDRFFTDEYGVNWIVDYKLSAPASGDNVGSFLEKQAETYREIMMLYKKAARGLFDGDTRAALYFPMIKTLYKY